MTATESSVAPADGLEAVERARSLFAPVREQARRMDEERHVPHELIRRFTDLGLVRTLVPRRFGGLEYPITTALEIAIELGKASGSMGWVASLLMDHALFLGRFGDQAQRDVWEQGGPDTRIATSFAPLGEATPVEGGWMLEGTWSWVSGAAHCDWIMMGAVLPLAEGEHDFRLALVEMRELEIVDTWFSAGLRGTGSDSVRADGVFVPEHRTLSMELVREGRAPGSEVNEAPMYRKPLRIHGGWVFVAPAIGAARGVQDEWEERARTRVSTYTREQLAAALPMQLALGEAAIQIDIAEMLVRRCIAQAETPGEVTLEDRVRNRRDITYSARLLMRAVDDLVQMAGASALHDDSPVQRGWRDVRAASCHIMLNFNAAAENYGRMALGLPLNPHDPFF
jgi:3-hydroxy-9,10-secoandrosta-1,3,5(10)-triene-9,17-dione monooxygenase